MPVVQSYYGIQRNEGTPAIVGWLDAFLGEREAMNRQVMAQRLKDAGIPDEKLLEMEADLRQKAASLAKAKGEALAGQYKSAMELDGKAISAAALLRSTRTKAGASTSVATANNRARLREHFMDVDAETRRKMYYDEERGRQASAIVHDYTDNGFDQNNSKLVNALVDQLDAQREQTETPEAADKLIADQIQDLRARNMDAAADVLSKHYFKTADDRSYMMKLGAFEPDEIDEIVNSVGAGIGGESALETYLNKRVMSGAGDSAVSVGYKTTVPGDVDATEEDASPAPRGSVGVRVKGDASTVGKVLSVGLDPNASAEEIRAAFDGNIAALVKRADELAAERGKKKRGPAMFSGANYLLDNPNWIRDDRDAAVYEKVASRPVEIGERFMEDTPHNRRAFRGFAAEDFNPDERDPTAPDTVALSKGGDANVYRYMADVLDDPDPEAATKALARLPSDTRAVIAPYLDLAKTDATAAKAQLEKLAAEDPSTIRDINAADLRAAAKDPARLEALIARMDALDEDTGGAWVESAKRRLDEAIQRKDPKYLRESLIKIADAMEAGAKDDAARTRANTPAPPSPKVERERKETVARAIAGSEASAKRDADYEAGKATAMPTFMAWNEAGLSPEAIRANMDKIDVSTPRGRGFKEQLSTLTESASRPVRFDKDEPIKIAKPDPKQAAIYKANAERIADESNVAPWENTVNPASPKPAAKKKPVEDEYDDDDINAILGAE